MPTVPRNTLWAAGSARKRLAIERSRVSGMYREDQRSAARLMKIHSPGDSIPEMSRASRLREEPHASERRRERRRPAAVVPPPATWRGASTRPRRGGDAAATRRRRGGDPLAATPNEHPGSSGDFARRPWCARRRCPEAEMPTVPGHTSARTPEHCACPARGTYHLP